MLARFVFCNYLIVNGLLFWNELWNNAVNSIIYET